MRRRRVDRGPLLRALLVVCAASLLTVASACAGAVDTSSSPRSAAGAISGTTTYPPAKPVRVPVGISPGAEFLAQSSAMQNRELDAAVRAGITWLRIDLDWSVIEPVEGRMNFAQTDGLVAAARARGFSVLGVLDYTPRWAQDPTVRAGTTHGRPSTPEVFAAFASKAANHYAQQITTYEIWNEPNLALFFLPRPDAAYYTRMVQASYQRIHAAIPGATVLAGSLAPGGDNADGTSVAPTTFAEQMYGAGVEGSLDAFSDHPYSYPASPNDPRTAAYNAFYRLRYIFGTLQRHGDGARQIWLTEIGAPSAAVTTDEGVVPIDEKRQAEIIGETLMAAGQLGYSGPAFIYTLRDDQTGSPDIGKNFGLLRSDFSPKPAYAVVQQYTGAK